MASHALSLRVGSYDLSYEAENISWSNVDPGGCEIASFDLSSERSQLIQPGDKVRIYDGTKCLWAGRVAEPAKSIKRALGIHHQIGVQSARISCEGDGAGLKDGQYSCVYIDRDFSRWQTFSTMRQINWLGSPGVDVQQLSWQITADGSGVPALVFTAGGLLTQSPVGEAWYDAGPSNLIQYIRVPNVAAYMTNGAVTPTPQFRVGVYTSSDLNASATSAAGTNTADFNWTWSLLSPPACALHRFGLVQVIATGTSGTVGTGTVGATYFWAFENISVIGNHGIPLRSSAALDGINDGFYPSDIASHAVSRAQGAGVQLRTGRIDQTSIGNYIVVHYVQYAPIDFETPVNDMAKLAVAHWGVWPSDSLSDGTSEFVFVNYGTEADVFVSMADCDEADVSERLGNLYTNITMTYQDAAGMQSIQTASLPNYVLAANGITRSQTLDLGLSSAAAARVFGNFALQALFAQSRSAGSLTLPGTVRERNGAAYPTHWLRAGLMRARILDMPSRSGLFTSSDTDSFRISRVECAVDSTSGQITTRVEIDSGPNLMETLQARMDLATQVGSAGL